MSFDPTDEQQEAIGAFLSGVNLAMQAGAGCGKTSTLELIGRATDAPGQYMAFNRSIVNEASEKMPMNVASSTVHGIATRGTNRRLHHRLDTPRIRSWELAKAMGINHGLTVRTPGKVKQLTPGYLASLAMRGIGNYCASSDLEPGPQHVPWIEGIDWPDEKGRKTGANNREVRGYLAPAMARAWADLSSVEGVLPYNRSHAYYLKVWANGEPTIPGEYVMADECQDLSGVMVQALEYNRQQGKQIVLVGDTQQAIYGWAGCVNAFDIFPVDVTTYLTQSFRFGHAIAHVANVVLDELHADLRLVGFDRVQSSIAPIGLPSVVLCRGNSTAVEVVLRYQKMGKRPHLIGGGEEVLRFARAAAELERGEGTTHPDLSCFDSWGEVQAYVEQDPQGSELALLVRLIDEYGIAIIISALEGMIGERAADVVVSTAHKAKGREWDTVRIAPDFPEIGPDSAEELRLLYVTATRARKVLDVRSCEPLVNLLTQAGGAPPGAMPAVTSGPLPLVAGAS